MFIWLCSTRNPISMRIVLVCSSFVNVSFYFIEEVHIWSYFYHIFFYFFSFVLIEQWQWSQVSLLSSGLSIKVLASGSVSAQVLVLA